MGTVVQRYVAVCQQVLAAAAVAAVCLSSTGVMTLQIVGPAQTGALGRAADRGRPSSIFPDRVLDQRLEQGRR